MPVVGEKDSGGQTERVQRASTVESAGQPPEVSLKQHCTPREQAHGDEEISVREIATEKTARAGSADVTLSAVCGFSDGNMGRAADLHKTQVCATPLQCRLEAGVAAQIRTMPSGEMAGRMDQDGGSDVSLVDKIEWKPQEANVTQPGGMEITRAASQR